MGSGLHIQTGGLGSGSGSTHSGRSRRIQLDLPPFRPQNSHQPNPFGVTSGCHKAPAPGTWVPLGFTHTHIDTQSVPNEGVVVVDYDEDWRGGSGAGGVCGS